MARMYPETIDPGTESNAERTLFDLFQRELDDDYVVYHSVAWQGLSGEGRRRDGEADFVIAHPQRGILVLEAKGGAIEHDPRRNSWTSVDRGGVRHSIKDPFGQAKTSKYVLEDHVRHLLGDKYRVNMGHAVAFPDVTMGVMNLGPDKPSETILDRVGCASVSQWVGGCLAYWRGEQSQRNSAPGEQVMQMLHNLLGRSWVIKPALWGEFEHETRELIRLTEQQYLTLNVLRHQQRAAISGCAGSGKTLLAAEKASRLAKSGLSVLFTCYNRNLAAYLSERLGNLPNLTIQNFHSLCFDYARRANIQLPQSDRSERFYTDILPEALWQATEKIDARFDAIIVDEGQDFRSEWWIPLQSLLQNPDEDILYVFYDDNQRLYVRESEFPIQIPPFPLTVNCRNTRRIHDFVNQFYTGAQQPDSLGPEGRPLEVIEYRAASGASLALKSLINRLVYDEKIPTNEIVVLSPLTLRQSRLSGLGTIADFKLSDRWPLQRGEVLFSTVYSFKGLERAVVVLVEMERYSGSDADLDSLFYVGGSRAQNHLILLLPDTADDTLRAKINRRNSS